MGDTVYGDKVGGDKFGGDQVHGDKYVGVELGKRPGRTRRRVILLMSADPGRQPLRLDEEHREIDNAVAHAQAGERLAVRTAAAMRVDDLHQALLRHRPTIAHFSGHGSGSSGILLTDDRGRARPVPPAALSALFGILDGGPQCVVLNACFTDEQARSIAAHVPCVIGMRGPVLDDAAIRFAAGFYRGIAYGRSVRESYRLGRNQLELRAHPDADVPQLLEKEPGAANRPVVEVAREADD
jgi:hypothetical protein